MTEIHATPESPHPYTIEGVLPSDDATLREASLVIGEAFMTGNAEPARPDPFYDRAPIADNIERAMPLFWSIIKTAADKGHSISVIRDEHKKVVGASWVKPAGVEDISTVEFAKVLAGSAIKTLGLKSAIRYGLDSMRHLKVHDRDETYISMVGVAQEARGRGIGKTLIQDAIAKAGDGPVVLSTMDAGNVERYQKWGFRVVGQVAAKAAAGRPAFVTTNMEYVRDK